MRYLALLLLLPSMVLFADAVKPFPGHDVGTLPVKDEFRSLPMGGRGDMVILPIEENQSAIIKCEVINQTPEFFRN